MKKHANIDFIIRLSWFYVKIYPFKVCQMAVFIGFTIGFYSFYYKMQYLYFYEKHGIIDFTICF